MLKIKDWNSRLNSTRGVLLKELASANFSIVYGKHVLKNIPRCSTVMPDVPDIVVVKKNLTVCSALSSDHFHFTSTFVDEHPYRHFQTDHDLNE
jgi:hypothetical protein